MTSIRKIEANRRNARKSTGPKSEAGRRRSAQNAKTHGLNVPFYRDPGFGSEAEALADALAAGSEDADIRARAAQVAGSQIALERVNAAFLHAIGAVGESVAESREGEGFPAVIAKELASKVEPRIRAAESITRYERRALSRLKSDIRDFEQCRQQKKQDTQAGNRST